MRKQKAIMTIEDYAAGLGVDLQTADSGTWLQRPDPGSWTQTQEDTAPPAPQQDTSTMAGRFKQVAFSPEEGGARKSLNVLLTQPALVTQSIGKTGGDMIEWVGDAMKADQALRNRITGRPADNDVNLLQKTGKAVSDYFADRSEQTRKDHPIPDNIVASGVQSGLTSMGQMMATWPLAWMRYAGALKHGASVVEATRKAGGTAIGLLSTMSGLDAYDKYRDKGHDFLAATAGGLANKAVEKNTEEMENMAFFEFLTNPKQQGLKALGKAMLALGVKGQLTEQLAAHAQEGIDRIMGDPGMTVEQKAASLRDYFFRDGGAGSPELWDAALHTAIATATMHAGMGAIGAIAKRRKPGEVDGAATDTDLIGSANTAGGTGGSGLERRMNQRGIRKELDDVAAAAARELGTGYVEGINLDGAQQIPAEQPQPALQATAGPNVTNLLNFYADQSTGVVDAENATPADRALTQQRLDRMELAPALGDRLVQEPQQTGPVENPEVVPKSPEQVEAERYMANVTARDAALNKAIELEAQIAALGIESKRPDIHPEQRANLLKEINRLKKDFKAEDGMARFHDAAVKQMEKQRAAAAKAAEAAKPPKLDTQPTADMYSGLATMQTVGRNIPTGYEEVAGQDGRGGFKPIQKKQPASVPVAANEPNPVYTVLNDKITSLLDDIKTGKHTAASAFQELRANPWYDEAATYQAEVEGNDLESTVYAQFEAAEQDQPTGVPEVQAASSPSEVALPETPLQPADANSYRGRTFRATPTGKKRGGQPTYKVELNESRKGTLNQMREEVASGQAGGRGIVAVDGTGSTGEPFGYSSSFPEYFRNKGYTKKDVLNYIVKAMGDGELTVSQLYVLDDLASALRAQQINDALRIRADRLAERYGFDLDAASDLSADATTPEGEYDGPNWWEDPADITEDQEASAAGEVAGTAAGDQGAVSGRTQDAPRFETASQSGEQQGVLLTGTREFGKSKKPGKAGQRVSTSDLLDGFTNEDAVQPSLVAQPEAPKTATKGDIELEFNKRYLELYRQGGIEASRADDLIEDYAERPDVQAAFDMEADELTEHFDALAQDVRTKHQKSNKTVKLLKGEQDDQGRLAGAGENAGTNTGRAAAEGQAAGVSTVKPTDAQGQTEGQATASAGRPMERARAGATELAATLQKLGVDADAATVADGTADLSPLAKVFGKKVVWFTPAAGMALPRGMFNPALPDHIFINTKAHDPALRIFGHELVHAIRVQAPDLYKRLKQIVTTDAAWDDIAKRYPEQTADGKQEELYGELVADRMLDKGFWQNLERKAPSLFRAAARFIQSVISRIRTISPSFYTNDVKKADKIIASVMQEYAERKGQSVGALFYGDGAVKLLSAWHGSPHTFDKFSTDKIGTGEGAQAYGYGLYFAGNKEVAEWYRKRLSEDALTESSTKPVLEKMHPAAKTSSASRLVTLISKNNALDYADIKSAGLEPENFGFQDIDDEVSTRNLARYSYGAHDAIRGIDVDGKKYNAYLFRDGSMIADDGQDIFAIQGPKGRLYKVELAPAEDEYLLWDKPLSEQSEKVKAALKKGGYEVKPYSISHEEVNDIFADLFGQSVKTTPYNAAKASGLSDRDAWLAISSGQNLYGLLEKEKGSDRAASEYLHSLGIRGIKYLDGTSRGKGDGNYNYVIFNDADVEITAKFSLDRVLVEYGQGAADAAIAETPKGRADVEQVAAQFGKKIVWYTGKTDRMKNTGGMYLHTDPDTIYLNAESRTPSMFILGHELTHALKRQAPDLYKRLQDIAFHSSGLAGYRAEYEKTRKDLQGDALNELVDEEMRADVVGTMFTKRTFWDELMAKSPRLFRTVAKFVSDILGKITRDIKAPSALLMKSDAGQVSTLVAEVMQAYADRMNTTVEQAFDAASTPQLAAASTAEMDTALQTLAFEERDEQTKYAHAVLDKIKDYWSDFVDTTAVLGDNFRTLRYLAKGAVAMAEEKARLHHDRLKKFRGNDVVNKQVYAYLTTKDADANMITNAQAREAAIDSKNEIIAIGRELVRRGLMKEEALWEHEGSYLPRLYAAHVIGADAYGEMYATDTTGSKKLNRDYLNRRKDIPQDVRDLILGEIKDPAYLVSMALAKPLRDIALHQWMKQIATVKEWAMPKLLVDWNMSTSPTYQIGNMAYTKNENGTYNITETAYKRVWDEVKAVDMNFIKERLGRNVAKLVMQTAKTNKQVEFGQLKYKLRPDGLYDLKLQRREATETHHDNIAEADLAGIVGEQRAGWMRSGTITSQRGERPVRTVGGRQVTPFYLAKEAARLRDMVAQKALPDDSLRLADRMERTAREALRDAGFDFNDNMELKAGTLPDQWRQLPDTAAYGPLRGMVVRKQIYNDIVGQPGNANTQLRGLVGMLFGENGLLNVSHRVWKAVKTTLNPGTHAANFMSNAVLMHINTDMKAHQVPQYLVKAVNAMATKNRMFREAQKYGFTSAGFAVNEIGRINTELIEYMAKQDQAAHPMQMVKFIAGKFYNQAGDIYQLGETLFKTAVLIHGIENGKHPAEAAIEAQDALMDYSDVSASVRFLRQYMLGAPFLTFTFKVTEQLAKNTIKNGRNVFEAMRADMGVVDKAFAVWRGTQYTRKLATWTTLLKLAPGVAASMIGLGDDEWEKLKASLPDWAKARGHFLLMPWQNDDGTYTWWDISRWHPIDPLVNIAGSLIGSEGEAHPMRAMGVLGGPIPQVVTTLVTAIAGDGIDPFTGRAIAPSREGLTKSEVFARYMNYAINMTTPSIMFGIGADIADVFGMNSMSDVSGVPSNKLVGYLTGKRSARTGNQTTMGEALAPLSGSNVYNLDPRFEASKKLQSMRLEMIGLRSNMQKALANPNMKDADRDRTISYWQEKISRLQKKMSDYSDATN